MAPRQPQLDHVYYPHLVDHILSYASREALLNFRATSRAYCIKADRALFRHVAIDHWDRQYRPTIVTPSGARLPMRWQDEDATPEERARWLRRLRLNTKTIDYCRSFNAYIYDPELAQVFAPRSLKPTLDMVRRVYTDSVMETFLPVLRACQAVDYVTLTAVDIDGQSLPASSNHLFPSLAETWTINVAFDPAQPTQALNFNIAHPGKMECTRHFVFTFAPMPSGPVKQTSFHDGPVGRALAAVRPFLPTARVTFIDALSLDRELMGMRATASAAEVADAILDAAVSMEGYPLPEDGDMLDAISFVSSSEYKVAGGSSVDLELDVMGVLGRRAALLHAPEEVRAHSRQTVKKQQRRRAAIDRSPIPRVMAYPNDSATSSMVATALGLALPYCDKATTLCLRQTSKATLRLTDSHLFSHVVTEVAEVDPYLGPSLRIRGNNGRLPGMCWEDPNATSDEREWWTRQLALVKTVDYPDRIHEVYDRSLWKALSGAETACRIDCLSAVGGRNVVDYVDWTKAAPDAPPQGTVGAVSASCQSLTINIRYDPRHSLLNQAKLNIHLSRATSLRKVTYVFEAVTDGPSPESTETPALEPFSMLKDITTHIAAQGLQERSTFVGLADIPREALELPPCTKADRVVDSFLEAVMLKWHARVRRLNPGHAEFNKPFPEEITARMRFLSEEEWGREVANCQWPEGVGCGRSVSNPPIFG